VAKAASQGCAAAGVVGKLGGTYVCMEGPQFSTKAESHLYRSWGADVIGMTNLQEAKLAREAEICYATVAMVTDYDCWREGHDAVTIEEIVRVLHQNAENAAKVVKAAVAAMPHERKCACASAAKYAVLTKPEAIPAAAKEKLKLLFGQYQGW
jgi:5'-methylthioadenosine phosphorylase